MSLSLSLHSFIAFSVYLVDCGWSEWSKWSECSATCGRGESSKFRQRFPNHPQASYGGLQCDGEDVEYADCDLEDCREFDINILMILTF